MSDFNPVREILPAAAYQVVFELPRQWLDEWEYKAPGQSQLWVDHFASVEDYKAHKAKHPYTNAGAMIILYSWAPFIIATCSVLTLNPTALATAGLMFLQRKKL